MNDCVLAVASQVCVSDVYAFIHMKDVDVSHATALMKWKCILCNLLIIESNRSQHDRSHTHNRSPFYCTFREWKNIQTKCSEEETKQKKTTGETERTREQMNERQLRNSCYDLVYLLFARSQNLMNEWIACQSWQSIEENDEAKIKWIVSLVWYGSLIVLYIFTLVSLSFAPLSHSAFSSLEFARDSIDQLIIIIFLIQFNSGYCR